MANSSRQGTRPRSIRRVRDTASAEPKTGWSLKREYSPWVIHLLQLGVLVAVLALWQLLSVAGVVSNLFVSRPTLIVTALGHGFADGTLGPALQVTIYETAVGFVISAVLGIAAGLILYEFSILERLLRPFFTAANNMPRLALVPIFVLWFGVTSMSHIVLIVTVAFFLVFYNTYAGLLNTDRDSLLLAKVLGSSRWKLFTSFMFPSAAPSIFVGLQLGMTYSFMSAVISEMITGGSGLGAAIQLFGASFDSAEVFAVLLLMAIISTGLAGLIKALELTLLRWRKYDRQGLSV